MPSCPTLPTSHRLAEQHGLAAEELCTPETLPSLLDAVRTVPDPRAAHLVAHRLPMLLGLVACALLCGVRSVRGVVRWASGQAGTLAALKVPDGAPDGPPVATTLTRAPARLDADVPGAAVGAFVQAHTADSLAGIAGDPPVPQLAADGKTVHGARDSEGLHLHLLGVYHVDPGKGAVATGCCIAERRLTPRSRAARRRRGRLRRSHWIQPPARALRRLQGSPKAAPKPGVCSGRHDGAGRADGPHECLRIQTDERKRV